MTPTPILHALFRTAFPGRGIIGQLLARLLRPADPGRSILACTEASADRAGGCPVVLVDRWRLSTCKVFGAAGVY